MFAYKCDRCGKVWERREPNAIESLSDTLAQTITRFVPKPRKERIVSEILERLELHSYHLCNDCETSFKNWFVGGKTDEETA